MSDLVPRLDTVEFDQLVEQARGDIPRYAPDWTDHNLHDPGMTLIDLLAWIVDQQVYRTGFVGGRHRRAFAALLGQRPSGPEPARGLVWPNHRVIEGRFLAAGSEVICLQHPDLPFTLDLPLTLDRPGDAADQQPSVYVSTAVLTGVGLTVDGVERPAPSFPADGGSWALGSGGGLAGTVLSLRFDRPLGPPAREAAVSLGIEVAPPPGPALSEGDRPWGPVGYWYRVGAAQPVELRVLHDGTAGLAASGAVLLEIPPAGAAGGGCELRLSFDRGFFPVPPAIRDVAVNALPVVQRQQVPARLLTDGTGQPDQTVELDTTGLVRPPSRAPDGPVLEIEVGGERWEEQPDLARSGPGDPHYVVRPDQLLFGNGLNGRRPELGAPIAHTELARTRGAAGKARQGLSWSVPALGADGAGYGGNHQPMTGGADATGAEALTVLAREAAIRRSALLTDDELVKAARDLAGMAVGRAQVVAGFDRRLPDRRVDGVRTLVVVPHQVAQGGADRPPGRRLVAQDYLTEVARRLGPGRVLGERLVVQGPVTVAVDLWLTITTEPWTVAADVATAVEQAIGDRLSVVARSDAVEPWPMGRDLTISEVEAIAANVPGVADVQAVRVAIAGHAPGGGPITVPRDGLVVAGEIAIAAATADLATAPSVEGCG
jgi:hypothetical protein